MKLRFSSKVFISVEVPEKVPEIQIPPMLFISLIENAFKHGVSYQTESYVIFKMELIGNRLICSLKNSKLPTKDKSNKQYSGIGMTNMRKSLALLYENDYKLDIIDSEKEFEVQLTIPVYETSIKTGLIHRG